MLQSQTDLFESCRSINATLPCQLNLDTFDTLPFRFGGFHVEQGSGDLYLRNNSGRKGSIEKERLRVCQSSPEMSSGPGVLPHGCSFSACICTYPLEALESVGSRATLSEKVR